MVTWNKAKGVGIIWPLVGRSLTYVTAPGLWTPFMMPLCTLLIWNQGISKHARKLLNICKSKQEWARVRGNLKKFMKIKNRIRGYQRNCKRIWRNLWESEGILGNQRKSNDISKSQKAGWSYHTGFFDCHNLAYWCNNWLRQLRIFIILTNS